MSSFEDVTAVNDPKRSEHGNPVMAFLRSSHNSIITGYAEAKDFDISLDKTMQSEQLRRYAGYANLFLTNYLRLFNNCWILQLPFLVLSGIFLLVPGYTSID